MLVQLDGSPCVIFFAFLQVAETLRLLGKHLPPHPGGSQGRPSFECGRWLEKGVANKERQCVERHPNLKGVVKAWSPE